MSEVVHYRGTLTKFEKLENETLEEQCRWIAENREMPDYFDSYIEFFEDEYYKEFVIVHGDIYCVSKQRIDVDEDIFSSKRVNNSVIEFEVKYYNGGCGFNEAIDEALKNIK
jgi:hypothetical protein